MEGQISLKSGSAEVTLFSILVMGGGGGEKALKCLSSKYLPTPPPAKNNDWS